MAGVFYPQLIDMDRLSEVYDLEQEAETATLQRDFDKASEYHTKAADKLTRVIENTSEDEFHTRESLQMLKFQILDRIKQLDRFATDKAYKQPTPTIESTVYSSEPLISAINMSLIKNLNIDVLKDSPDKVKFIDADKINLLEHQLQLLNFKEKSSKSALSIEEVRLKSKLLEELNSVYYTELMANKEFVKSLSGILQEGTENPVASTESLDRDEQFQATIGELQQKISELQREKLQLEDQIVMSKERWNNLVENARKRKDRRKSTQY